MNHSPSSTSVAEPISGEPALVLAIETALLSGSLAFSDGKTSVDTKNLVVGRSEVLLPSIANLFGSSDKSLSDLREIAVSVGPGSFTGIRIGIATAIGLSSALDIPCVGVTTLDAIEPFEGYEAGYSMAPLGRDQFAVRYFDRNNFKERTRGIIEVLDSQELVTKISTEHAMRFYLPFEAKGDVCAEPFLRTSNVVYAPEPTALQICHIALTGLGTSDLTPHYIRRES